MVLFYTTRRTGLVIRIVLAILAGLCYLAIETDEPYCDWGYIVKDSTTCIESNGLWGFRVFGIMFILNMLIYVFGLIKYFVLSIKHKIF